MSTISTQEIARTILQQLGGNRFVAMTGAKNFGSTENSLSFKIGSNAKRINHVKITLNALDLYDVTYYRVRKYDFKVATESSNVYCDMLQSDFTTNTGMHTSL